MELWTLNVAVSRLLMRNIWEIIIIKNWINCRPVQIQVFRNFLNNICKDSGIWVLGPLFLQSHFWPCVFGHGKCHLCSKFRKSGQNLLKCTNNNINSGKNLTYSLKPSTTSDRCKEQQKESKVKINMSSKIADKTNSKNLKNSKTLYIQNLKGKTNINRGSREKQTDEIRAVLWLQQIPCIIQ